MSAVLAVDSGRPLVSAVIPVWNGAATIGEAIGSVLAQDFSGVVEIIVVNDGSTDGTPAVLGSYGERIRVIHQENRGLAAARNAGVAISRGDYLAFLDADDMWTQDKLAKTVSVLERWRDCGLVYSDAFEIDTAGNLIGASSTPSGQDHAPSMRECLSELWNLLPSTMVVRRSLFDAVGGFNEAFRSPYCEDIYFCLLARERGPFYFVTEPLARYRHCNAAEFMAKRLAWARECGGANGFAATASRLMESYDLLVQLVAARYRFRARLLRRAIRRRQNDLLVTLGLTAMTEGNRTAARRSYVRALRYRPLEPRTYARFGWTLTPPRLTMKLAAMMPPRIKRSLEGPACG